METYIGMNTEFQKHATNEFEKNFYKLMNNSVFGQTMENVRNRVDIKIVRSDERQKNPKLIANPLIVGCTHFYNNLAGFSMHRENLSLDKPVYAGITVRDDSKILMYDIFFNTLKKQYNARCELIYTDNLFLEMQNDDVYNDMEDEKYL